MAKSKTAKRYRRVFVINVRKLTLLGVTLLMCALTVISVFLTVRRFFTVSEYNVVGISRYDREDLIGASGVKKGTLLYALEPEEIEKKILSECPYLSAVTVRAEFPNTLRIEVEGKEGLWYLDIAGASYSLDSQLRVIAETANTQGMTKLVLPNIQSAIYGEVPRFGESDTERKRTLEVIDIIRRTSFKDRLTEVNLASRWDIHLVVDGRYDVSLGPLTDLEAKLKATEAILAQEAIKEYPEGSVSIVEGKGGYTGNFLPKTDRKSPTEGSQDSTD